MAEAEKEAAQADIPIETPTETPAENNAAAKNRVVIFAAPAEPEELAELLVEHLQLHPIDARVNARAVPGILPGHFSPEKAHALVEAVSQLGLAAEVIAEEDIPSLERAEDIHHPRCTEEGLAILDVRGNVERTIPWQDIEMLSIGYVPLEKVRHYVTPSTVVVRSAPKPIEPEEEVTAFTGPEAWLIVKGEPSVYRIDHKEMNYECLGDRKTTSASRNFRLFVTDLIARTPQAYLTPATHAFLRRGLMRHYLFRSSEELKRYTRFHLLLLRRLMADAPPPGQ